MVTEQQAIAGGMRVDSCYWAVKNRIRLMGDTIFTLDDCEYMADIMRDNSRHICVMKGAQARITTLFMLRAIHSLIYAIYPQGVIYYFPTEKAVEGFSKTRFGPLISDNPCIRMCLKNTNSVSIKKVGNTFLSLLGAKSTTNLQGKKDGTSVRSTPADEIIRDERDLFDDDMADMTKDRLLNSRFKREVDLGTPTIPDFGIDKIFSESDQKFRMIKCRSCNSYTELASEFPNCVKYKRETTHEKFEPYFGCIKCGKEIFPSDGEYIPKHPDREISGYHVPHFITPNCDLELVMKTYETALIDTGKMGLFYNSMLGLPYIPLEDRLRRQDVFDCCGDDIMKPSSIKCTAMGADIMKTNRVVIAEKKKNGAKIIYMARVSGFDSLYDLKVKYNVKSIVACLRPYEEAFRKFQSRCKANDRECKVFGAVLYDKQKTLQKTDEVSGVYSIARTEMMDKSHSWVKSGKLEIPRKCEEVEVYAKEMCNTAKVLETNDLTGDRVYRYRPIGDKQEHYRHATNYLMLALPNLHDYQIGLVPVGAKSSYDPLTWGLN